MLPAMGRRDKKRVEEVLAENFVRIRNKRKEDGLLKSLGVAAKTANNVEKARHNTKLQTIVKLAESFGVEPYQMLIPFEDKNFVSVILAWAKSDPRGRADLYKIAEAILKPDGEDHEEEAASATVHGRRDQPG